MNNIVSLSEYSSIAFKSDTLVHLNTNFFIKFDGYLKKSYKVPPFTFSFSHLIAKQYVGIVSFEGHQFEVLPKMLSPGGTNREQIYRNLLAMLSVSQALKITLTETQNLQFTRGFLEIYIKLFAEITEREITLRPHRRYITKAENLNYVKGRFVFQEHLKRNLIHRERSFCEFDDFSEDNELNRFIKYVTTLLLKCTRVETSFNKLKIIEMCLSDVSYHIFDAHRAEKISLDRFNSNYLTCLNLGKLIIQNSSPQPLVGNRSNPGILFDMNKLFEEFIFKILADYSQMYKFTISAQTSEKLAKSFKDAKDQASVSNKAFNVKSDIVITLPDETVIIIDTKYKILEAVDKPSLGIENGDIYQILSYADIFGKWGNKVVPVLLFPQPDCHAVPITRIYKTSGRSFLVMTAPLHTDLSEPHDRKALAKSLLDRILERIEEF
jgi:5-methylcytosine-specific restriction enzyme subunit McrC